MAAAGGDVPANEIRVAATQSLGTIIERALVAFKTNDVITVRGLGGAISGAVQCAEVVRHRIAGVEMIIEVTSVANSDQAAKREKTSAVVITLSKTGKGLDKKHIGYHAAVPASEISEPLPLEQRAARPPRERQNPDDAAADGAAPVGRRGRGGRRRGGRRSSKSRSPPAPRAKAPAAAPAAPAPAPAAADAAAVDGVAKKKKNRNRRGRGSKSRSPPPAGGAAAAAPAPAPAPASAQPSAGQPSRGGGANRGTPRQTRGPSAPRDPVPVAASAPAAAVEPAPGARKK